MYTANDLTVVETLDIAEKFVVCAARVYRAIREQTAPPCTCLCRIFEAAAMTSALPAFVHFLNALTTDPEQVGIAEERGSRLIGAGETRLLQAVAHWQREPASHPESALPFVTRPAVRRIAAPPGRAFAVEMAAAGLLVPSRNVRLQLTCSPEASPHGDRAHEPHSLH